MAFSNFKALYRLVFISLASMIFLAACGQGIKVKELKVQTQAIAGSNYTVTFESLRVSSLNGYTADGTIKFVLKDVRTGASRQVSEFVRASNNQSTVDEFPSQGDEPRMTYSARCASITCDNFEIAVVFVAMDTQGQQRSAMALGVVQTPTVTKHYFEDLKNNQTSFEAIIASTHASGT